jgi:hypothetical protein
MMCSDLPDKPADGQMRCPTCGAVQEWADACRRCKCELGLLRRVSENADAQRRRCLWLLRAGRVAEALRAARCLYRLSPDRRAACLLAMCHLLQGNWSDAAALARTAENLPDQG